MSLKGLLKKLWQFSAPDVKPTLDLHGLSVKEALRETEEFVAASYRAGFPVVRIVYGKGLGSPGGKGILRQIIPRWCEKEGQAWVKEFQREVDLRGGDGSLILFLKKPQSPQI